MSSFREFDYSVRPAKSVERKMLVDVFRCLYQFASVRDYRYVGFGAIHFADFVLVHRQLGITDMVSIEQNFDAEECFKFNKPYRSIKLECKHSGFVLPRLGWTARTIIWLDYDGGLCTSVFSDIGTVVNRTPSGSFFTVTVNAHAAAEPGSEERQRIEDSTGVKFDISAYRLKLLRDAVGERIPAAVTGGDLRSRDLPDVLRRIILNEIQAQLAVRNLTEPEKDKLIFRQVAYFVYQDRAQMLTLGGVLVRQSELQLFEECHFERLGFTRFEAEPYRIRIPCLTAREVHHLNAQLETLGEEKLASPGVPEKDLAAYAELYRYFPFFNEVVLG